MDNEGNQGLICEKLIGTIKSMSTAMKVAYMTGPPIQLLQCIKSILCYEEEVPDSIEWDGALNSAKSLAQVVERPLSKREVVGSNPVAAPYQRCKKWY